MHADQLIRTARGAQLSFPRLCFWPVIVSVRFTKAVSFSGNVMEKDTFKYLLDYMAEKKTWKFLGKMIFNM